MKAARREVLSQSLGARDLMLAVPIVFGVLLVILGYDQVFTLTGCPPAGVVGSCYRSYTLDFAAVVIGGLGILIPVIRAVRKSRGSSR